MPAGDLQWLETLKISALKKVGLLSRTYGNLGSGSPSPIVTWSGGLVSGTGTAGRGERAKGESGGKVHNSDPAISSDLKISFDSIALGNENGYDSGHRSPASWPFLLSARV